MLRSSMSTGGGGSHVRARLHESRLSTASHDGFGLGSPSALAKAMQQQKRHSTRRQSSSLDYHLASSTNEASTDRPSRRISSARLSLLSTTIRDMSPFSSSASERRRQPEVHEDFAAMPLPHLSGSREDPLALPRGGKRSHHPSISMDLGLSRRSRGAGASGLLEAITARKVTDDEHHAHLLTASKHFVAPVDQALAENYRRTVQVEQEAVKWRMHIVELVYTVTTLLLTLINFGFAAGRVALGSEYFSASLTSAEYALDVSTCLLQVLNFFIAVDDRGQAVVDLRCIMDRYVKDPWGAMFDVLTTFPVSLMLLAGGAADTPFLRVNVIPRVLILHSTLDRIKELLHIDVHPSAWRLLKYAADVGVITTAVASGVSLFVREYDGVEHAAHWFEVARADPSHLDLFMMIWFHCLKCLTDQKLPYPRSDGEFLVGVGVLFVAILVFLVIIASVEEIIVEFIEMSGRKAHKIDHAVDIMKYMGLPSELQEEVADYYEGMYKHFRSFDFRAQDDLFGDLPPDLRADLLYETNAKVIQSIPIFSSVANDKLFIDNFVTELQECVVTPGAPIIVKGEEGDCMFFLHAGDADILDAADDSTVIFTLTSGSYFGEVAMLFGWKRSNTIVARTACSLYAITSSQFDAVMENFPEVLDIIVKSAEERAGMKVAVPQTSPRDGENMIPTFEWNGMMPSMNSPLLQHLDGKGGHSPNVANTSLTVGGAHNPFLLAEGHS